MMTQSSDSNQKGTRVFRIICIAIAAISTLVALVSFYIGAHNTGIQLTNKYNQALTELDEKHYQEAADILGSLGTYQNSRWFLIEAEEWMEIKELLDAGDYDAAQAKIEELKVAASGIESSENRIKESEISIQREISLRESYNSAKQLYDAKEYAQALKIFEELEDYEDSPQNVTACRNILKRLALSNTISAGVRCSAAIDKNGKIYFSADAFVDKDKIQNWQDVVSISVNGEFVIGLKAEGGVLVAKDTPSCRIDTSSWENIIEVATGEQYVVGLKSDGTLVAQGLNGYGETDVDEWRNIVTIATGWQHTVGLDSNGIVHITGYQSDEQLAEIEAHKSDWTDIVAIAAGGGSRNAGPIYETGHTVALKRDGTVVAVGDNRRGQCEVYGEEWRNIIAIAAGDYHTVGLRKDGTVVSTLKNVDSYTEIGEWKNVKAIAAGYGFTLALKEDGTVVGAGYENEGQRRTDGWKDIVYRAEWDSIFEYNWP